MKKGNHINNHSASKGCQITWGEDIKAVLTKLKYFLIVAVPRISRSQLWFCQVYWVWMHSMNINTCHKYTFVKNCKSFQTALTRHILVASEFIFGCCYIRKYWLECLCRAWWQFGSSLLMYFSKTLAFFVLYCINSMVVENIKTYFLECFKFLNFLYIYSKCSTYISTVLFQFHLIVLW